MAPTAKEVLRLYEEAMSQSEGIYGEKRSQAIAERAKSFGSQAYSQKQLRGFQEAYTHPAHLPVLAEHARFLAGSDALSGPAVRFGGAEGEPLESPVANLAAAHMTTFETAARARWLDISRAESMAVLDLVLHGLGFVRTLVLRGRPRTTWIPTAHVRMDPRATTLEECRWFIVESWLTRAEARRWGAGPAISNSDFSSLPSSGGMASSGTQWSDGNFVKVVDFEFEMPERGVLFEDPLGNFRVIPKSLVRQRWGMESRVLRPVGLEDTRTIWRAKIVEGRVVSVAQFESNHFSVTPFLGWPVVGMDGGYKVTWQGLESLHVLNKLVDSLWVNVMRMISTSSKWGGFFDALSWTDKQIADFQKQSAVAGAWIPVVTGLRDIQGHAKIMEREHRPFPAAIFQILQFVDSVAQRVGVSEVLRGDFKPQRVARGVVQGQTTAALGEHGFLMLGKDEGRITAARQRIRLASLFMNPRVLASMVPDRDQYQSLPGSDPVTLLQSVDPDLIMATVTGDPGEESALLAKAMADTGLPNLLTQLGVGLDGLAELMIQSLPVKGDQKIKLAEALQRAVQSAQQQPQQQEQPSPEMLQAMLQQQ